MSIALYKTDFKEIKAYYALEILCWIFDQRYEPVLLGQRRCLLIDLYDDLKGLEMFKACDISMSFTGGPPSKQKWVFDSSLLTLLIDRLLHAKLNGSQNLITQAYSYICVYGGA